MKNWQVRVDCCCFSYPSTNILQKNHQFQKINIPIILYFYVDRCYAFVCFEKIKAKSFLLFQIQAKVFIFRDCFYKVTSSFKKNNIPPQNHKQKQYCHSCSRIATPQTTKPQKQIQSKKVKMASLKDKLKSKIKSKAQQTTMESFDESSLTVQLLQGKHQLQQLNIMCSWNQKNKNHNKPPKLRCKWYNRTLDNYQEIEGIEEEHYQPSILDIDSIIEITCIPELSGVNYEGMPILLKSQPIALSPQTQNEARYIVQTGKTKIFTHIKQAKLSNGLINGGSQTLIQIDGGQLSLILLGASQSKDELLLTININEEYPHVKISRKNPKELFMELNSEQNCTILFKNNEIRDTFCLFLKLFVARTTLSTLEKVELDKEELKPFSEGGESDQKIQCQQTSPQIEIAPEPKQEQKPIQNQPQEQPQKQSTSATEVLQLLTMKNQLKHLQTENQKLSKELSVQKEKAETVEYKLQQTNQRLQNATKNYFQLQEELKVNRKIVEELRQQIQNHEQNKSSKDDELVYYHKEIKLLNDSKTQLQEQLHQEKQKRQILEQEVHQYRQVVQGEPQQMNYQQLLASYKAALQETQEFRLKYEYQVSQIQQLQEHLKNYKENLDQVQSEKKYIEKKYQSLTNQLHSNTSSPLMPIKKSQVSPAYSSKMSQSSARESSLCGEQVFEDLPPLDKNLSIIKSSFSDSEPREKELLQLKQQIKDLVDENTYIRSVLTKQKKPGSRSQLKVELYEAKKIVSRLSQNLTEKDQSIAQMKEINKYINMQNNQLSQEYQQLLEEIKK